MDDLIGHMVASARLRRSPSGRAASAARHVPGRRVPEEKKAGKTAPRRRSLPFEPFQFA